MLQVRIDALAEHLDAGPVVAEEAERRSRRLQMMEGVLQRDREDRRPQARKRGMEHARDNPGILASIPGD